MTSAPSSVALARTSTTGTGLRVSWSGVTGATTYEVQLSTNGGAFRSIFSAGATTRSVTTSGSYGSSYRARVNAAGPQGVSPYTTSNTVTIPFPIPSAPPSVTLSRVDGDTEEARASIRVTWSAQTYATSYDVERSENGGSFVRVRTGTTSRDITFTGLNRGSGYRFRVRSNGSSGSSGFTTSGTLTLVPFRPSSVSASLSGDTSIRVTWPSSSGATGYDVDRSQNGGGYSRVSSNTSSRDITYGSLDRGSTYRFRVFARNAGGSSPTARESDSVLVPFPPPSTPPSATATKTKRDVRITFSASTPPSGTTILNYEIEIRENGGSYGSRRTDNGGGETYTNLNPGSTYQGRVRAIGEGGASGWRETNTVAISPPPSIPASITLTRSFRNVFVELGQSTAASDVTISGYEIQRRESFNGGATWGAWGDTRATNTTVRNTTYSGLTATTTQQFRGRATSDFEAGDWRTSDPFFIPGIPDPPSQVLALQQGASIQVIPVAPLSDGGSPILTYTIEKRISDDLGQSWTEWGNQVIVPGNNPVYLYEGLELQKTYQFRALATNGEGNSESFTESNTVYLPVIVRIFEGGQFRLPADYKRYDEEIGAWIGLSTYKRFFDNQWVDLT
jgi:hypothetical protein